jgi:hypothetical protein
MTQFCRGYIPPSRAHKHSEHYVTLSSVSAGNGISSTRLATGTRRRPHVQLVRGCSEARRANSAYFEANTLIPEVRLSLRNLIVRQKVIKHHAMKAYGGTDVQIHVSLTSALVGAEYSASRPSRFTTPGGWMGPTAGPDERGKEKIPDPIGT